VDDGPSHFSRIPLAELRAAAAARLCARAAPGAPPPAAAAVLAEVQRSREVAERFPLFAGCALASFELRAGDRLYLPPGWFHEVESLGVEDNKGGEVEGLHMALNHWFHPATERRFAKPYLPEAEAIFASAYAKQLAAHEREGDTRQVRR